MLLTLEIAEVGNPDSESDHASGPTASVAPLSDGGRWVSAIACLLGYFWMLWDKEMQTWHDKFATDVVVPVSSYPVASWPN